MYKSYGKTEIFSAQDFDGVREDIPFDKWYMAGKLGVILSSGLRKINPIPKDFHHHNPCPFSK